MLKSDAENDFVNEALAFAATDVHKAFISSTLPNSGEKLSVICEKGLTTLDALFANLDSKNFGLAE